MSLQNILVVFFVFLVNTFLLLVWLKSNNYLIFLNKYSKILPIFLTLIFIFIWFFIFIIYKFPVSGDIVNFFIPQGKLAFQGLIPNKDFTSSYMPLFPYLMGFINLAWNNNYTLGLFFTVCLCVSSFVLFDVVKENKKLLFLLPVCLCNSVILLLGVGYQQDELFIVLLIILSLLLIRKNRFFYSGLLIGLTVMMSKITIIIFWIPLFLMSEKKKSFLFGLFISTVPIMVYFLRAGFSITRMLGGESGGIVPPNLIMLTRFIPALYQQLVSNTYLVYLVNILLL